MALFYDDPWPAIPQDYTGYQCVIDASNSASRSTRLASCFLELEKINQDLESKLRDDFHSILNSMDRFNVSRTSPPRSPAFDLPTRSISSIHNPSFTLAAYSWLLENIANPYPSSTIKESLAQRHNCLLSAVNTWFVNARRRTGWTALCRDYFNNCRADTLDAAYRALVNEDPCRPLPPDVTHAFINVKATAEDLYSSTCTKSALPGILDAAVKGSMDQDTILLGERKRCEPKEMKSPEALEDRLQSEKLVARPSYAYPDSSSSSSPVPSLVESLTDDSDHEEVSPPILAGRKRRLSCSESIPTIPTSSTKRRKFANPTCPLVDTCLSYSEESLETLPRNQLSRPALILQSSTNISASHKQCISAEVIGRPKRPQELATKPDHHIVSDSLPLSTLESERSIDEWFNSNFDDLFSLPPSANVIEPDLSAEWEVELFSNYNVPPEELQTQPFKPLDSFTGNQTVTPTMDSLPLDNILQSLENGTFIVPSEITDPTIMLSVADCSVPRYLPSPPSPSSSGSIDWAALLDRQTSNPLESAFGQSGSPTLPKIDLSFLQLP